MRLFHNPLDMTDEAFPACAQPIAARFDFDASRITVETPSGMLNAIGLDNDGLDHFLAHHLPYLRTLPTAVVGNIAGQTEDEFVAMAALVSEKGDGLAGLELNLSCPNVSGGLDFATDPDLTRRIVRRCRDACSRIPLIAKLTPNVTDIAVIAKAAADGGADAVSAVNTFVGMAVDWRRRKPILGNVTVGLSGPAIKPLALRAVWRIAQLGTQVIDAVYHEPFKEKAPRQPVPTLPPSEITILHRGTSAIVSPAPTRCIRQLARREAGILSSATRTVSNDLVGTRSS